MSGKSSWVRSAAALKIVFTKREYAADREAILQGVHSFLREVYVLLERTPGGVAVVLTPKTKIASSAERAVFEQNVVNGLASARLRCAIQRSNLPAREHILSTAFRPAPAEDAPAAAAELSLEQRAEIDRLIAEVETELKTMNAARRDPKGITATWEEKHERKSA